ncbi:MAG TPA: DUF362 domain-containing protein [Polyangiaceae bacterium]|jgi:uncharacterized protein (DUF362 family)
MDRRAFLASVAASAAAATLLRSGVAHAGPSSDLAATLPSGFVPLSRPGHVVRVKKSGCLEANGIYPKPDDAKAMLQRAMTELTGKDDLVEAVKQFVHPQDKVCVKVNGIALQNMSTNKELVLPFVDAMIAAGVQPSNITLLEAYPAWMQGTRITPKNVPAGVQLANHGKNDATMDWRNIPSIQRRTKFARSLTESTALITFGLVKDHSQHGYTGALKTTTHGTVLNPQDFHELHGSPQIAVLAAQDIVRSRFRLAVIDGFKLMAHGGPLYKQPQYVVPHESVYVSTDPVAVDAIGWAEVEKARAGFGLKTLKDEDREPAYIRYAEQFGVGVADLKKITLRDVTL